MLRHCGFLVVGIQYRHFKRAAVQIAEGILVLGREGVHSRCALIVVALDDHIADNEAENLIVAATRGPAAQRPALTLSKILGARERLGGIEFRTYATGGFTFTAPTGNTFTKIEMMAKDSYGWGDAIIQGKLGTGWPSGDEAAIAFQSSKKVTWTGNASTVNLLTGADNFYGSAITSIVFTLQ